MSTVRAGRELSEQESTVGGSVVELDLASHHPERFIVIESCHSTWLFDTVDQRFCRVLRTTLEPPTVATDWRGYDRLVVEDATDAFVVFLDSSGTRLLRSWRHSAHCTHCGRDWTAELSLEDLRKVARA
jgi:hypothetical protein